jgi:hypothetical protein
MGLLQKLLTDGSLLDIEVPSAGGGPINDTTSGFVQEFLPNNTFLNSIVGQPDNGSTLVNTLNTTALDNTDTLANPPYPTPSPLPDLITTYPASSTGEFGGASAPFTQPWSAANPYLGNISTLTNLLTNPQVNTLNQTALDNTDLTAAPTALTNAPVLPDSITSYPPIASGEFNGASTGYTQPYSPTNTYLSNVPTIAALPTNPQANTLGQTALDNTDPTTTPTALLNAPILPDTITTYPSIASGEFNSNSSPFTQPYSPTNTYLSNVPTIASLPTNPQANTLGQTALDNTNPSSTPTALINTPTLPDTITTYSPLASGEFNGAPAGFTQPYSPDNTYLDPTNLNIVTNQLTNPQVNTLSQTALDNSDLTALPTALIDTPIIPDTITSYPAVASGEFNGAASGFTQPWSPSNTYLDSTNITNLTNLATNPQTNTLNQTALDNTTGLSAPTADINAPTLPDTITSYPAIASGIFNGAPTPFTQPYNQYNTYLENVNIISDPTANAQVNTLYETALDNTDLGALPTALLNAPIIPDTITVYPPEASGINGGATPFSQSWGASNKYYNYMKENYSAR